MVMVGGAPLRPFVSNAVSPHEWEKPFEESAMALEEPMDDVTSQALAQHERLVAYTHLIAGEPVARSGVWSEHSYARLRYVVADLRVLFEPITPPASDGESLIDIDGEPPATASDTLDTIDAGLCEDDGCNDDDYEDDEDDWEDRVVKMAPSSKHVRLVRSVAAILRSLRLAWLAEGRHSLRRREALRSAARRLRRALATLWARGAMEWLNGALLTALPRGPRAAYSAVLAELSVMTPHTLERRLKPLLSPASAYTHPHREAENVSAHAFVGESSSPWLVWVGSGCAESDARWTGRLRLLMHVRELPVLEATTGPPERWCAALVASARASLADVLVEAGQRPVVLCGFRAGASLAATLAAAVTSRLIGIVLLAPPLLTAEGACDEPDDLLQELLLPVLCVVGTCGATCSMGAVGALCGEWGAARRVLAVNGADDALRLAPAARRRLALPQHALDAALVEECARWASELATLGSARVLPQPAEAESARRSPRIEVEDEEYLPVASSRPRMVSRVTGKTPLMLLPPRRTPSAAQSAPPAPAPAPHPAHTDIMQLPIVFADDEQPPPLVPSAPAQHESGGGIKVTRVIVARRRAQT